MKKLLLLIFLLFLVPLSGAYFSYQWLDNWGVKKRLLKAPVEIVLKRGQSLNSFSEDLKNFGLVEHPLLFSCWTKIFSDYSGFQAGRYLVSKDFSIQSLVRDIKEGNIYQPEVLKFTIPEGFTIKQIADRLAARGVGEVDQVLALARDKQFLDKNSIKAESIEGYLYPATYSFTEMPDVFKALSSMVDTFWNRLPKDYVEQAASKGLTLQQAVTFASLIELETHHDSERSLVSEVIWNRLNKNIALAIDASIIYGIEDYQGDLKRLHLEDSANLYNTRKHRGLPPGPIGNPSLKSLEAVLNPTQEGNFYYVLDFNSGRHNFSKTLKQHNQNVRKMLKDRRLSKMNSK